MLDELGISLGTAIIILIALYFIIKWGVKNGIKDYFNEKEANEKQLDESYNKNNKNK